MQEKQLQQEQEELRNSQKKDPNNNSISQEQPKNKMLSFVDGNLSDNKSLQNENLKQQQP